MSTKEFSGLPPTTNDLNGRDLKLSSCHSGDADNSFFFCNVTVCSWVVFDVSEKSGAFETSRTTTPNDAASHFSRLESSISNAI